MDKNFDACMYGNNFSPYMSSMYPEMNMDPNNYDSTMFNPMNQYEQGYVYYRYMCKQLDYKMKCREYEKMCGNPSSKNDKN